MVGLNGEPLSYAVNVEAIDEMKKLDPSMSPDAAVEKLLEKTFGSVYGNLPISPLDDYFFTTKDKEQMKDYVQKMTAITMVREYPLCEMDLFTVASYSGKELMGWWHTTKGSRPVTISNETLIMAGADASVMKELLRCSIRKDEDRQLMMVILHEKVKESPDRIFPEEIFFMGVSTYATLAQRCGLTKAPAVKSVYLMDRFSRNMLFRSYISHQDEICRVLYRTFDGCGRNLNKIFAVFSSRYGRIEQDALINGTIGPIEKEMGESIIHSFSLSHEDTALVLEFPEKAREFSGTYKLQDEVIPVLIIRTSDAGNCSVIIRGGFRMSGKKWISFMPGAAVKRQHTSAASTKKILSDVSDRIFSEYTKIPERMVELLSMDPVDDPAALTEKIMEGSGLRSLMRENGYREELERMKDSYGPSVYGPYDVCMRFMDLLEKYQELKDFNRFDHIREKVMEIVFHYRF